MSILPVVAPAGLIGMFDEGLTILLHQAFGDGVQALGELMKRLDESAGADPGLFLEVAQSNPAQIMFHGHMGQKAVAEEGLGEDFGGPCAKGSMTARAPFALQAIDDLVDLQRLGVEDRTVEEFFRLEGRTTEGTLVGEFYRLGMVGLGRGEGGSAMAGMTGFCPSAAGAAFGKRIGFDRQFRRGGGRAEKSFLYGSFLITESRLQANDFFLQFVDSLLFFKAFGAVGEHGGVGARVVFVVLVVFGTRG